MRTLFKENYLWLRHLYAKPLYSLTIDSKCNIREEEVGYLYSLLPKIKVSILYRASEDGWHASNFHSRCDSKGSTITLFQIRKGDCVGGFTKVSWSSKDEEKGDSSAMLFNLTHQRCFPSKNTGKNVHCNHD